MPFYGYIFYALNESISLKISNTAKGYITVEVLRDILHELDDKITPSDLDLMIDEIDADGSGTVDFEGTMTFTQTIKNIHTF